MQWVKKDIRLDSLLDSSLYKQLEPILNNSDNIEVKQLSIENTIKDYNKSAFNELLKTPKLLYGNMGLKLLLNTIKTLRQDLNDFKKSKYTNNKKYKDMLLGTDNSIIISIVLSSAIPFIFKNTQSINYKVLSLYKTIGNRLLNCYLETLFDQYKIHNNDKPFTLNINLSDNVVVKRLENHLTNQTFRDIITNDLNINEEFLIQYGMDMV